MNDDPLDQHFRALRKDDASAAPSFDSLAAPTASAPRRTHSSTPANSSRPIRPLWPWQLALGGTTAVAVLVAFHLAARISPASPDFPDTDLALVSDQLASAWSAPSDALLADTPHAPVDESTAQLIRDIDHLLQRPSPL